MDLLNKVWAERFGPGVEMEIFVGACFLSEGLQVYVPKKKSRDTYSNKKAYGDSFDIQVINPFLSTSYFLEVKSRDLKFTGIDDYPFDDVFIENKNKWDNKPDETKKMILCHIIVSQQTGAMFTIGNSTRDNWKVDHAYDYSVGGGHRLKIDKYVCSKLHAKPIEKLYQFILNHKP